MNSYTLLSEVDVSIEENIPGVSNFELLTLQS